MIRVRDQETRSDRHPAANDDGSGSKNGGKTDGNVFTAYTCTAPLRLEGGPGQIVHVVRANYGRKGVVMSGSVF